MPGFTKFIDMARSDEEKIDAIKPLPMLDIPDYPYGLRICLDEKDIEKLDLEHGFQVGEVIDLRALATVTSVSMNSSDGGDHCRVEMQIEKLAVEIEDDEDVGGDDYD